MKASPTRGWRKAAPKLQSQRRELEASCGRKCFLVPDKLGYPICARCKKNHCSCKPSCAALSAAYNRAKQYKHRKIAAKALAKAKREGCGWASGK
jgi:hypothetical protein